MPQATLPAWAADLARRLAAERAAPVEVTDVRPLAGGACQDNVRVDLVVAGVPERWVVRSDARASLPGSIDRAAEAALITVAVAHGVPTPRVLHWLPGLLAEGAGAYAMPWVEGVAIGARVLRDPALAAARERLPAQLAAALAAIHRVRPVPGLLDTPESAGPGRSAVEATLGSQRTTLDRLPDPQPGLELVLRWLAANAPSDRPAVLVHGDFRTGNFLVGPDGLRAVLDWEFARWGSPADDLGWFCVRDWRFGHVDREAGGLVTREAFLALYAEAGGEPVTADEVRWWEVAGNLRWALGAHFQAQRVLQGHERDLELLAIGRRACEMEAEALRLIGER